MAWHGTYCTDGVSPFDPLNLAHHPTHVVLDLGFTRSIGSRTASERFQKHALCYDMTTEFCPCNQPFVFANLETENWLGKLYDSFSDNTSMFYQS